MDFTKIDFKKLFSTRNIIILASAVLVLTLTLTLVFCAKKDEDEPQGGDQSGQVTPDSGNPETPETPSNPETPTDPETPETPETPTDPETPETPTDPEQPGQPEHTHAFVEGKCECGEKDPTYIPEPITYAEYLELSKDERTAYYKSFGNPADFYAWYNAAKDEYEEANSGPSVGEDGSLDMGDIFGD